MARGASRLQCAMSIRSWLHDYSVSIAATASVGLFATFVGVAVWMGWIHAIFAWLGRALAWIVHAFTYSVSIPISALFIGAVVIWLLSRWQMSLASSESQGCSEPLYSAVPRIPEQHRLIVEKLYDQYPTPFYAARLMREMGVSLAEMETLLEDLKATRLVEWYGGIDMGEVFLTSAGRRWVQARRKQLNAAAG